MQEKYKQAQVLLTIAYDLLDSIPSNTAFAEDQGAALYAIQDALNALISPLMFEEEFLDALTRQNAGWLKQLLTK